MVSLELSGVSTHGAPCPSKNLAAMIHNFHNKWAAARSGGCIPPTVCTTECSVCFSVCHLEHEPSRPESVTSSPPWRAPDPNASLDPGERPWSILPETLPLSLEAQLRERDRW